MSSSSPQRPLRVPMPQSPAARRSERTRTQVVSVRGDVDLHAAPHLSARLRLAVARRPRAIIVDLSATTMLDSAGIATLVAARRRADKQGVPFCVVAPPDGICRRALEIVGCVESLSVVDDRLAAIATVDRDRLGGGSATAIAPPVAATAEDELAV